MAERASSAGPRAASGSSTKATRAKRASVKRTTTKRTGAKAKKEVHEIRLKAVTAGAGAGGNDGGFGRSRQKLPNEWQGRLGLDQLVDPPLEMQELADLLLESTDFMTVVNQISSDVAGLGWHLAIDEKAAESVSPTELEDQKQFVKDFFKNAPGGEQDETLRSILQRVIMDWESTGNGYLEVSRNADNFADGLYHIPAVRMRMRRDKQGYGQLGAGSRSTVWFRRFGANPETGLDWPGMDESQMPLNEIIWWGHYHPASFWYGIPRIVPAIAAVRGNQFVADRNIKFFFNKALPEIALIVSGSTESIRKEDLQEFINAIQDHFMTEMQGEHFKPLIIQLPNGVELRVEKLSPESKDADHQAYRKGNRDEILRAYAMMPNRVGIIETGNLGGGTGQSQIEIYKTSVIKPRQEDMETKITQLIRVGLGVKTWKFKFDEIDTIDEAREATIANILGTLGWLTINEGRQYTSKFLKIEVPEIDEEWANYPFPVIAPQLAVLDLGIGGLSPFQAEEPVPAHMFAEAGVDVGPQLPGIAPPQRMAIDRAYRTLHRLGQAGNRQTGTNTPPAEGEGNQT